MPNKHLEHLEDSIFDGRRVSTCCYQRKHCCAARSVSSGMVLLLLCSELTLRMVCSLLEPSPSSTKSKSKSITPMKISIKTIQGHVADILRLCLRHLPHIWYYSSSILLVLVAVLFIALILWSIGLPIRLLNKLF